jgi:hypothetical protein
MVVKKQPCRVLHNSQRDNLRVQSKNNYKSKDLFLAFLFTRMARRAPRAPEKDFEERFVPKFFKNQKYCI